MGRVEKGSVGFTFYGSVECAQDLLAASSIAEDCPLYVIDDDDEDYCEGTRTCFNCRFRRWLRDGFLCGRGGEKRTADNGRLPQERDGGSGHG